MPINPVIAYTGNKIEPRDLSVIAGAFDANLDVAAGTILARITAASAAEVQTINYTGTWATADTIYFTITGIDGGTYNSAVCTFAANALAASVVKAAIEAMLDAAGYEGATVTVTNAGPTDQTVAFGGTALYKNMPLMTCAYETAGDGTAVVDATTRGSTKGDWAVYSNADAESLGLGVARGIAKYDFRTDHYGRVVHTSSGASPQNGVYETTSLILTQGDFLCSELTGLDSGAIADLGRLLNAASSSDTGAILRVY